MIRNTLLLLTFLLLLVSCDNGMKDYQNAAQDYAIIPKPVSMKTQNGRFVVNGKTTVSGDASLEAEGKFLADFLSSATGQPMLFEAGGQGNIHLKLDEGLASEEAYTLDVTHDQISISGKTGAGVFYGIQTLRQLMPASAEKGSDAAKISIPAVQIEDAPQFAYRGMHLDVGRHFFPVDFVKHYIDILAMHKMNRFHWHLTEDQGWRIEIKKYPKLTEVGAWRNGTIIGHNPGEGNDNEKYGGFYTQEEVKDVIAYAAERHITIIPEIELPGHSSAAIAAYPSLSCFPNEPTKVRNDNMSEASKAAQANGQPKIVQEGWGVFDDIYCAGNEETFDFLEDVLSEVMDLFPSAYIHIGGDECPKGNWKRCAGCQKRMRELGLKDEHELQSYFIGRIEKFINSKDKNIIGWDEILEGGLAPNATVMSWRGIKGGIEAAKQEHDVIMTPTTHVYFDYYQSKDKENEPLAIGGFLPIDKVYSYDPIPEEIGADKHKYILGGQANLWTEYIKTGDYAEYMLLPRMTALAEVVWTPAAERDWEDFKGRLDQFKARYDALGLNYGKHVFQ